MRGVVFTGERELEPMQFPDPTPDAHDVVIEMRASRHVSMRDQFLDSGSALCASRND